MAACGFCGTPAKGWSTAAMKPVSGSSGIVGREGTCGRPTSVLVFRFPVFRFPGGGRTGLGLGSGLPRATTFRPRRRASGKVEVVAAVERYMSTEVGTG
eukprot:5193299-Heterocapsa_arctica.AAC.1